MSIAIMLSLSTVSYTACFWLEMSIKNGYKIFFFKVRESLHIYLLDDWVLMDGITS